MKNKKLNACIIGLGQVGIKFDLEDERKNDICVWTHFSAYERLYDKYNLIAAVDPDKKSWKFAKSRLENIKCFSSIDELKNSNLKIDVVSIASPDQFHYKNLTDISYLVKGIFLEKPISTIEDTVNADFFIKELLKEKKSLYINYNKRVEPTVEKMLHYILNNKENIKYIECKYSGPFIAVGSHAIDLLNYIVSIKEIKTSICHEDLEGDGYSAMMLGNNNELINLSYTGKRHEFIFELEVITNQARYELTNNLQEITCKKLTNSKQYSGYMEYELDNYSKMANMVRFTGYLETIYNEVINNKFDSNNIEKSIETQKLINKIMENKIND